MLIESRILLKNHISWKFMLNITSEFHSDSLRKLEINFSTYSGLTKFWKFVSLFYLSNWINQRSFEVLSLDNVLINGNISEIQNSLYVGNYCTWAYHFYMMAISNEILENFICNFHTLSNFSSTWNKEAGSCW